MNSIPLALGCIGILLFLWFRNTSRKRLPYPPGPHADPLTGHLRHIPSENQENVFYEWGKIYGDIMHLHVMGRSVVILNSAQAATDLLDRRSSNYSDRPSGVVTFELMGWSTKYTLAMVPYGKQFQLHRRMLHQFLTRKKCLTYRSMQTREAHVLLRNLLSDEERRENFIHRFSAAIIMQLAYGHQIISDDDPYVKIAEDVTRVMSNSGPSGNTPVDAMPFLQYFPSWFPGTYYAKFARDSSAIIKRLHNYPFEQMQKSLHEGKAKPSFLSCHLEALNRDGSNYMYTADDIKGAGGMLYFAAADTTASSLSIFFLAMVLNPECQVRAQKEIDAVVGTERLPDFGDRGSLPYIDCLVQETLRWNNAVPLAMPHRSIEDDVYRGMFIPKGSLIIANIRAMTLDDKIYTDPHDFKPTRFLPKPTGDGEPYPNGPFGFGRRICPGRHLAEANLWIAIASILATFHISKATGKDGNEITPTVAFHTGGTSYPYPYQCRIRPRNDEAVRRLIAQADAWNN